MKAYQLIYYSDSQYSSLLKCSVTDPHHVALITFLHGEYIAILWILFEAQYSNHLQ